MAGKLVVASCCNLPHRLRNRKIPDWKHVPTDSQKQTGGHQEPGKSRSCRLLNDFDDTCIERQNAKAQIESELQIFQDRR